MLVDTPMWPAHDRLWAHLVSDSSLVELHAFAAHELTRRLIASGLRVRARDR